MIRSKTADYTLHATPIFGAGLMEAHVRYDHQHEFEAVCNHCGFATGMKPEPGQAKESVEEHLEEHSDAA